MLLAVPEAVSCLNEARSRTAGQSHLYTYPPVPEAVSFKKDKKISSSGLSLKREQGLWEESRRSSMNRRRVRSILSRMRMRSMMDRSSMRSKKSKGA